MNNEITDPAPNPEAANQTQLAVELQCSEQHVRRLTKAGKLPFYRLGDLVRYSIPDVIASLKAGTVEVIGK